MEKKIKVQAKVFPIELIASEGKYYLRDLMENVYEIRTKNNIPITTDDWNTIIDNRMGFWEVAKKYQLVIGDYKV
jgi:ribose 5-phosphate isomerase